MPDHRRHTAIALLLAASAVLAGCATPIDESLRHANERMRAARAEESFRAQASGPFADAERTLAQANEAEEPEIRHHFTYMTEKNLDIAEAIVARKRAEREIEALLHRRKEARSAPQPSPPSEPGPGAFATNLLQEMERERLETALREAREARARAEQLEKTLEKLESQAPPDLVVQTVPDIHFAAGTTELSPGAKRRLDPLVVRLRDDESLSVIVEGYTDTSGTHEANLQVSLARAQAVKSYLVEQGIAEDRIQTLGLGADYPIASNDTADGRRRNRRVEIVLDRIPAGNGADRGPVTGRR